MLVTPVYDKSFVISLCTPLPTRLFSGQKKRLIIRKIKYEIGPESYWDWYVTWLIRRNVTKRQSLVSAHFQSCWAGTWCVWREHNWIEQPYFSSHSYLQCLNLFGSMFCCSVPELFTKDFVDILKCWEGECTREVTDVNSYLHIQAAFPFLSTDWCSRPMLLNNLLSFLKSELLGISFLMNYEISLFSCFYIAPLGGGACSS